MKKEGQRIINASILTEWEKAKKELGWTAKKGIKEMCEDSWNFIQKNK